MAESEGIVKYVTDYTSAAALSAEEIAELNAWRRILYLAQLVGQSPERYMGYGFGNVSRRLEPGPAPVTQRSFVITGTQTGNLTHLDPDAYTMVMECYPAENRLVAQGPVKPSSESLTHGAVYDQDPEIMWVFHAHSPEIWRNADALEIPVTAADVPYGSPEMAAEVDRLFRETPLLERRIFSMGGHEDGIVSFGRTAEEAGDVLLNTLAAALALSD
ncbi:MAG: class II aldolase/adducin family protein [Caldilineaceae bacterium]|nr:class II aldolase/adducin family protein [Caldilineaceae bacterium]MCB9138119.1 class II aldolase/adducin family protein [Caldilineaceae bacterium]